MFTFMKTCVNLNFAVLKRSLILRSIKRQKDDFVIVSRLAFVSSGGQTFYFLNCFILLGREVNV